MFMVYLPIEHLIVCLLNNECIKESLESDNLYNWNLHAGKYISTI